MGSKPVEISDETCHVSVANHCSVILSESKAYNSLQHTASETSNLLSVNSSYDSLSENAESRAPLRYSNTSDDLEGVEKLPNTYNDSKVVEVHENISCVSKVNDTDTAFSNHDRNLEKKNRSGSSASVGSVGPEEFGKPPNSVFSEMPLSKDGATGSGLSKERLPELMDSSLTKEPADKGLEVSTKVCPNFEAETSDNGQDPKQKALKCSGHGEQDVKSNEMVETAAMQPSQSVNGDDSEESDTVEQDVKVCDICGDAGREESLATCSRCSDGAEHIYCMRKMLRRVPKGDWLCEECKFAEQIENQKPDIEGNKMKKAILSTQLSNKRRAGNTEAAPSSKRQVLETRVGSPKPSSPKRTVALSRESSFKGMDKDKLKSAYQTSISTNDITETARSPTTGPRLQTAKGALLKSNSFNMYSKPKAKLADNIVPQKLKGSKEHSAVDMKERTARMMGKSVSFRSPDTGRFNGPESKVKMLPSKFNPLQDLKGLKQAKDRSTVERKNLSKLERPLVGLATSSAIVSTPKVDQASRGDTNLLSSVSNLREHKALLSDGKSNTSSKAISSLTRKGAETQSSPGGSSPISGMCNAAAEQKANQVISNNEPLSSYSRQLPADVEGKLEGVLRSSEMAIETDQTRESSVRSRPIVAAGPKGLFCSICKEIGHTVESCKSGILETTVSDVSPPKSYKEEVPKSSRLKDAIHAALLRKPEIYRKKTVLDQSDELSISNMESSSEAAAPEFVSNMLNNNMCTEGSPDGQAIPGSSNSDCCKNTLQPADSMVPSRVLDSVSVVPNLGKSTSRDLQRHASVGMSFLMKTTAIPEYEYIWQGSFELQRGGNIDICGGIQAHLSTCASPKVLEVVNKFPHKVPLEEVPRLSVWPTQFHQSGVKEDNIALYFFAKDLESYERNYKILIDAMIKNDLALKGKFGGVELLILPSNQLPEKSQRWNMLYFLWGVFRETRVHYIDSTRKVDVPGLSVVSLDNDTPTVMTLSKNLHVPEHIDAADRLSGASYASKSPEPLVLTVSKDLDSKVTYPEEMCYGSKENLVLQDSRGNYEYTANNADLSGAVACTTPTLQEVSLNESRLDTAGHMGKEGIADRKNMIGVLGDDEEEVILKKVNIDKDEFTELRELKRVDGFNGMGTAFVTGLTARVNSCQSNSRIHPHIDLSETAASSPADQEMPWNVVNNIQRDGQSASKKSKLDSSELHDLSTSKAVPYPSAEGKNCPEECDEKVIPEDLGTTERHFFPVESRNIQDFRMDNSSLPWKNFSSGNEDKSDGFPSLELALRAEAIPPSKGNLPFFVGLGDERDNQDRPLEKTLGEKEDDVSASLSLSLSFPFPDKEQPVTKSEQLVPERHHVNTSLLLFGRFPEK